jgi:hypothetical protein
VENPNFAEVGVRSIGSPHVLLDLTRFFTSNFGVRAEQTASLETAVEINPDSTHTN